MVLILFYRRSSMKWMVGIVLWIGLIADLRADSINVPNDYQTIQGAIDAASSGDIVLVDSQIRYRHPVT